MAAKRCPFCRKKLDDKGYCQNVNCVDYPRTKKHEEEDQQNPETPNEGEGQN
jgi:hypothetical protein